MIQFCPIFSGIATENRKNINTAQVSLRYVSTLVEGTDVNLLYLLGTFFPFPSLLLPPPFNSCFPAYGFGTEGGGASSLSAGSWRGGGVYESRERFLPK